MGLVIILTKDSATIIMINHSVHIYVRIYDIYMSMYILWHVWLIEAEWCIHRSVNYAIIGSDNGLSPVRRQAIIWSNVDLSLIEPLWTNFSETWIRMQQFSKKKTLKMSSAKWQPFCVGLMVTIAMPTMLPESRKHVWITPYQRCYQKCYQIFNIKKKDSCEFSISNAVIYM